MGYVAPESIYGSILILAFGTIFTRDKDLFKPD